MVMLALLGIWIGSLLNIWCQWGDRESFPQSRQFYGKTPAGRRWYPAVELCTGVLFAWCFIELGWSLTLIKALLFTSFLVLIAFIDYKYRIIPDNILFWLAGTGITINLLEEGYEVIAVMLSGVLAGGGLLLFIAVASRGGMGGGDIKFAAVLGLWLHWQDTLLALFLAFVTGGAAAGFLIAAGRKGRKDTIPFAPFIAAGAFTGLLYGRKILSFYLQWPGR